MRRFLVVGAIVVSTVLGGTIAASAAPPPGPPGADGRPAAPGPRDCAPAGDTLAAGPGARPGGSVPAPGAGREPVTAAVPAREQQPAPPPQPPAPAEPAPAPAEPPPAPAPTAPPTAPAEPTPAPVAPTPAATPAPAASATPAPAAAPEPAAPATPTPTAAPTAPAPTPSAAAPAPAAGERAARPTQDEPDQDDRRRDEPRGSDDPADTPADIPADCDVAQPRTSAGHDTSAAALHGWGEPNRVDEFEGGLGGDWNVYDGVGHAGNGRRTPDAVSVDKGILTITGDSKGSTAGMAWNPGQRYGRWEGRVKAPASDESYNALLLLWPDAEDFPVGGEIDFMEMMDHTRQTTNIFLHYGENNDQVVGEVQIDGTQWHNWAVEWTPTHVAAFVDGKEWWRTTDVDILPPRAMHLCIQLDWFPDSGKGQVKESHMYVDWVKQYPLDVGDVVSGAAEDALRIVEQAVEGVGDLAGGAVGGVTDRLLPPLTEGGPDAVPSRRGLVDRAVRAGG